MDDNTTVVKKYLYIIFLVLLIGSGLSAQSSNVLVRPMKELVLMSEEGELIFYDEPRSSIPSVLSQKDWELIVRRTPLDAFIAYYNLRSFADYQKISFTEQKYSQKKDEYFKNALVGKGAVSVNVEFVLRTRLEGSEIAFVKYRMEKSGIPTVYGCYSFRKRGDLWFYSGEKGKKYHCVALAYLKNDVLEYLATGKEPEQEYQRELRQLVRTEAGLDITKLVEVVGEVVARRKGNPARFNELCNQIK